MSPTARRTPASGPRIRSRRSPRRGRRSCSSSGGKPGPWKSAQKRSAR